MDFGCQQIHDHKFSIYISPSEKQRRNNDFFREYAILRIVKPMRGPMRKKSAKRNKSPEYDSRREQNVLLERIGSDVKTIAEGHGALKQEIGQLRSSMEQRFDVLEMAVTQHSKDIKALRAGQEELKAKTKNLETGQEELKANQEKIKQKLDSVIANHEERLQKLEAV